jgi:hypothetical protein
MTPMSDDDAPSIDELRLALEESVQLQSHYAQILNMHDGGQRLAFANAAAWIQRLLARHGHAAQEAEEPVMTHPFEATTRSAAELTEALRAWLRRRPESPDAQAAAMAYETAALIAKHADSVPQAFALVDEWARSMKWQIHELGIGVEHP